MAIALSRPHPGCSMGPVTDGLRPLPHLSLLLPPMVTSIYIVGGSVRNKVTIILSIPLGHQS